MSEQEKIMLCEELPEMTEQELTTFTDLYIKFQERCKHIAEILSEYDCDFEEAKFNDWKLDYDGCHSVNNCCTDVDIIIYGCLVDTRNLHFPVQLITATDEQIRLYTKDQENDE